MLPFLFLSLTLSLTLSLSLSHSLNSKNGNDNSNANDAITIDNNTININKVIIIIIIGIIVIIIIIIISTIIILTIIIQYVLYSIYYKVACLYALIFILSHYSERIQQSWIYRIVHNVTMMVWNINCRDAHLFNNTLCGVLLIDCGWCIVVHGINELVSHQLVVFVSNHTCHYIANEVLNMARCGKDTGSMGTVTLGNWILNSDQGLLSVCNLRHPSTQSDVVSVCWLSQ